MCHSLPTPGSGRGVLRTLDNSGCPHWEKHCITDHSYLFRFHVLNIRQWAAWHTCRSMFCFLNDNHGALTFQFHDRSSRRGQICEDAQSLAYEYSCRVSSWCQNMHWIAWWHSRSPREGIVASWIDGRVVVKFWDRLFDPSWESPYKVLITSTGDYFMENFSANLSAGVLTNDKCIDLYLVYPENVPSANWWKEYGESVVESRPYQRSNNIVHRYMQNPVVRALFLRGYHMGLSNGFNLYFGQ